jgi:hypothetical protein
VFVNSDGRTMLIEPPPPDDWEVAAPADAKVPRREEDSGRIVG